MSSVEVVANSIWEFHIAFPHLQVYTGSPILVPCLPHPVPEASAFEKPALKAHIQFCTPFEHLHINFVIVLVFLAFELSCISVCVICVSLYLEKGKLVFSDQSISVICGVW